MTKISKYTAEQSRAVFHNQGNILVSASAGSGKTYVMIERIIRLILEEKASIDSILAMTFTTAAAEEMKEKLRSALCLAEDKNDRLKQQSRLLAQAQICTIHSFCASLLRSYFYMVDVNADFNVLDEKDANLLKSKAIELVFDKNYQNQQDWFLTLTEEFNKNRRDLYLKNLVLEIYSQSMSRLEPINSLKAALDGYNQAGFLVVLEKIKQSFKENIALLNDSYIKFYNQNLNSFDKNTLSCAQQVFEILDEKLKQNNFEKYFNINLVFIRLTKPKDEIAAQLYEEFKDFRDELKDALKKESSFFENFDMDSQLIKFEKSGQSAARLVKLIEQFEAQYSKLKAEENALDFEDLQHKVVNLLENQDICAQISAQYSYIFTDEYQDVNDVQELILNKISDNNLFMVGDLKQSIYAFRGCNPEFFTKKFNEYQSGKGKAVHLSKNFRSSDKVISAVNDVFSAAMTLKTSGIDYKKNSMLEGGGLYPKNSGAAHFYCYEKIKQPPKTYDGVYDILSEIKTAQEELPDLESLLIAQTISKIVGETFYDIKIGQERQILFEDITVLARSRKNFGKISAALASYGIGCVSDAIEDINAFPEIRLILEILKFIDNSYQEIPLAAVLKYVGGLSNNQLTEIKMQNKESFYDSFLSYIETFDDEISRKSKDVLAYFESIKLLAEFESAAFIIDKIFNDRKLYLHFAAMPNGQARLLRIERIISQSKTNRQLNCREFLNRMQNFSSGISASLSASQNAVNLMTIHSSKGLEFPVVILAGCGGEFNMKGEKKEVFSDAEYGIVTKCIDTRQKVVSETVLRTLIKLNMRKSAAQDEMRVLYVAMTRAQHSLYVLSDKTKPSHHLGVYKARNALRFSDFFTGANSAWEEISLNQEYSRQENSAKKVLITKPDKDVVSMLKKYLSFEYKGLKNLNLPSKLSVTAALSLDENAQPFSAVDSYNQAQVKNESFQEMPFKANNSAKDVGTAYHIALQYADYGLKETAKELILRLVDEGKLSIEESLMLSPNHLDELLNLEIFNEISKKTLFKEREFFVTLPANLFYQNSHGDILLQGAIDLIAQDDDGAHIIDFKYSTLSAAALVDKYGKQLFYYSKAYQKITGKKVNRLTILNILSKEVINISANGKD